MKKIFTLLLAAASTANVMATNDDNIIRYDFENYKLVNVDESDFTHYSWYELNDDETENDLWASGNSAFATTLAIALSMDPTTDISPAVYPTVMDAEGYDGACVKLETRSTGYYATIFNMGIAAGNLFTGFFDTENAMMAPMQATQFGKPFYKKPVKFTGYYKYAAGAAMQDGSGNAVEGTDKGQIYSVLYRNEDADGNPVTLNGENILISPQIVAIADAGEIADAAEWTPFEVEFDYKGNAIDEDVLAAGGYSMATVFTSSVKGAEFIGAVGSTLYVDKVAIECEAEMEAEPKEYKGNLVVTMGGESTPQPETSIYITKQNDGKYTLNLKNFMLAGQGIGTITIKDVEGTEDDGVVTLQASQSIMIEEGDDPAVSDWMGPVLSQLVPGGIPVELTATMSETQLNATITINMLGGINVEFNGNVPTGISGVHTKGNAIKAAGIYTVGGVKVDDMRKGQVYILRDVDGTTKKVVKK